MNNQLVAVRVVQPFIAEEGHVVSGQRLAVSEQRATELESFGCVVRVAQRPLAPGSGVETKPEPAQLMETKPQTRKGVARR